MSVTEQPAPAAPDLAIRSKPPSPKRLSRKVLFGAAAGAALVMTLALVNGLSSPPVRHAATQEATPTASGPPETIAQASADYDARNLLPGDGVDDASTSSDPSTPGTPDLSPPQDPMWANGQGTPVATATASRASTVAPRPDPEAAARSSPILFATSTQAATQANSTRDDGDANLDAALRPPRSPYEIQAGNVIPAALVTGLNSDLPGSVIAQVTAPVYDSVSGNHLLIPQGARLIGTYDNGVRYGDHRILLVWNRLILPNGWSINLREMNASDPSGAAGLADKTDNHLDRLAGAVALSAIVSVVATNSENDQDDDRSPTQSVGDAAAQQAAQTGSQVVQRELTVRPSLTVRPGAPVRVLVMRDIQLRPYR